MEQAAAGPGDTYYCAAVYADDEVEPGLDGQVLVGVAQDLEAEGALGGLVALRGLGIKARDEAVQGSEHAHGCVRLGWRVWRAQAGSTCRRSVVVF